jgi:hypothetical protein
MSDCQTSQEFVEKTSARLRSSILFLVPKCELAVTMFFREASDQQEAWNTYKLKMKFRLTPAKQGGRDASSIDWA